MRVHKCGGTNSDPPVRLARRPVLGLGSGAKAGAAGRVKVGLRKERARDEDSPRREDGAVGVALAIESGGILTVVSWRILTGGVEIEGMNMDSWCRVVFT